MITDVTTTADLLTAVPAGGTIRLAPGLYTLPTYLIPPANTRIIGAGPDTILQRAPGLPTNVMLWAPYGGCQFQDFVVDGNQPNNATNTAAEFVCTAGGLSFERVEWRNFNQFGMDAEGSQHMRLRDCTFRGIGSPDVGGTVGLVDVSALTKDLVIDGCWFFDHRLSAVFLTGSFKVLNSFFSGNHRQFAVTGGGQIAFNQGARSGVVANNTVETGGGPVTAGIEIDNITDGIEVYGNFVSGQGLVGIVVEQVARHARVHHNTVTGCGRGVVDYTSGQDNVCADNVEYGNGAGY